MKDRPDVTDEDVISPEEAENILRPEVEQLIAGGWRIAAKPLYGVRLVKGNEVLDMRVDLLGNVERKTKFNILSAEQTGRLIAWVLLITSLLVTLALASALGFLD